MQKTDHSETISICRERAASHRAIAEAMIDLEPVRAGVIGVLEAHHPDEMPTLHKIERLLALMHDLAADLLEAHDDTGISLDNWDTARKFVKMMTGTRVEKNHV